MTIFKFIAFSPGVIRDHSHQIRRHHRAGVRQVADIPDLLLPDVSGHRPHRSRSRAHLPASIPQLLR